MLAHEASRLQLGVFAAPRTEGIWDEVRAETVDRPGGQRRASRPRSTGEYGAEICGPSCARRAAASWTSGTSASTALAGSCTAIFLGAAAIDPERAGPLRDVLQGLVVDRGAEARPVGEALPMRLPPEAEAQLAEQTGDARPASRHDASGCRGRPRGTARRAAAVDRVRGGARREELRAETAAAGCTPVHQAQRGQLVSVTGRLRTVVYTPRTNLPTLEADLYDGSDVVTLVWLGRRQIAGIEPGRALTARGRVAVRDDRKVIYNPYYELETQLVARRSSQCTR